jgi:hypothetical protein
MYLRLYIHIYVYMYMYIYTNAKHEETLNGSYVLYAIGKK